MPYGLHSKNEVQICPGLNGLKKRRTVREVVLERSVRTRPKSWCHYSNDPTMWCHMRGGTLVVSYKEYGSLQVHSASPGHFGTNGTFIQNLGIVFQVIAVHVWELTNTWIIMALSWWIMVINAIGTHMISIGTSTYRGILPWAFPGIHRHLGLIRPSLTS